MYKNKKILAVLSTAAVTGLLISAINSTAFAKTTAIAVTSSDGKVYEYQYDALKTSAISQQLHGSNDSGAKLYNDFLQRKTTVKAYFDNVRKSYVDFNTICNEALNCIQKGTSFNLDSFTESTNIPTTTINTNKVSVDNSGNLAINGQTVSTTVDMTTIKCSNPINTFSTLVSFKLSVSNPEDYNVSVKGNTAILDSTTGIFAVYINGNVSVSDIKASDFTITKESDKPIVKSVNIIDNKTIRVCFNKNVDYQYATNISNYQLLNSNGVDISNHISGIYSNISQSDTKNTDTYNIKLKDYNPSNINDDWRLTTSKYTLTIKNVIDTSSIPNAMDEYTCVLNSDTPDTSAPTVTGIYANLRSSNHTDKDRVVVYFNKAMDSNTLVNKDNYVFTNGLGDNKTLPLNTSLTCGDDSQSVIIEFPSDYHVITNSTSNTGNSTDVLKFEISNVKDESGNLLNGVSYISKISDAQANDTCVKSNTIKTYYEGDDLKVSFQFTRSIDTVSASDFTFGGVTPNSIAHDGNIVTLTFKDGSLATASEAAAHPITYANGKTNTNPSKIDVIKSQGQSAKLAINATGTTDETGALISSTLSDDQSRVYDYEAAPRTTCFDSYDDTDYWTATKDSNGVNVYITFDTPLDANSGIKSDDFRFTSTDGTNLKADSVKISGNTLVFKFDTTNKNYASLSDKLLVTCTDKISLRGMKDADGNYAIYMPSSADLKVKNIQIIR